MQSRRRFAVGVRFWGKSMDGVFRLLLGRFIQRGTIIFTTAGGTTFTCGDGTGEQVHARLTSPLAQRRLLLDPELALGEIYMDGGLVMQQGSIADLLAVAMGQPDWTRAGPNFTAWCATGSGPCTSSIRAAGRATTSLTTTIWTAGSTRCFWIPTSSTAARISRRPTPISTTPSSPRSATSQRSC